MVVLCLVLVAVQAILGPGGTRSGTRSGSKGGTSSGTIGGTIGSTWGRTPCNTSKTVSTQDHFKNFKDLD